ncbi:MAG: hypothetical protein ACOH2N_09340 [Devosia sp.]
MIQLMVGLLRRSSAYRLMHCAEGIAMPNYRITLDGHGERLSGEVITRDGEVIGSWRTDENDLDDFYQFIPDGEQEPTIQSYNLGMFCFDIEEWHEGRQQPDHATPA